MYRGHGNKFTIGHIAKPLLITFVSYFVARTVHFYLKFKKPTVCEMSVNRHSPHFLHVSSVSKLSFCKEE